jgi:hypothetical protein
VVILDPNHRLPMVKNFDVTLGRKFSLGGTTLVRLEGTIYNILNADNELELATLRLDEGEIFTPDFWTQPRRIELRLGFQF